ncbi:MAG: PA2778 family cysteine peptidase [Gammaproteobacteria bacterium]|jgi:tetratricopeptide (TPR) repeat protein
MTTPGALALALRLPLLLIITLLICACAARTPVLTAEHLGAAAPDQVELVDTPFIAQERYQCGPASLAMLLQQAGVDVTAEVLVRQVYLPERKGSLQAEMVATSRRYQRIPYVIDPDIESLAADLRRGSPVLVLQNLGLKSAPVWHYAVVIGYSVEDDLIILRSGTRERQLMPGWLFVKTWNSAENWGMVLLPPGQLPARPDRDRYLRAVAAAERHIDPEAALKAYDAALEQWPNDSVGLFGRANALHTLGKLEEAEQAYRHLLAENPGHVAALNNLAEVYMDLGCYREADSAIRRALMLVDVNNSLYPVLSDTRKHLESMATQQPSDQCSGPL